MSETSAGETAQQKPDKLAIGCGLLVAVPIMLIGLIFVCGMAFGGDNSSASSGMAEVMCEDFVEDRLKAPSTAEFDTTASGSGPTYTVTGTVDSQNSFGGMVRNNFECVVTHDGGNGWTLDRLDGLGS